MYQKYNQKKIFFKSLKFCKKYYFSCIKNTLKQKLFFNSLKYTVKRSIVLASKYTVKNTIF